MLPLVTFSSSLLAAPLSDAELARIANAIKRIENSTKYPYGVKSIDTKGDEAYARKITINSIRNNWSRYEKSGSTNYFGDFMADRWCPAKADPQGNINWKKNFRALVGAIQIR